MALLRTPLALGTRDIDVTQAVGISRLNSNINWNINWNINTSINARSKPHSQSPNCLK